MKSKSRDKNMTKPCNCTSAKRLNSIDNKMTAINTRLDIVLLDHEKRISRAERGFIWMGLMTVGTLITGAIGLLFSFVKKGN